MFMIGEAAGVLGTTHEYEVKIQEACLSLCHIVSCLLFMLICGWFFFFFETNSIF